MQDSNRSQDARMADNRVSLISEALTQLFDFVAGTAQSGRIGVFEEGSNKFVWIGLSLLDGHGFSAITNDWFDIVPCEPSFHAVNPDPAIVFDAAINHLCTEFAPSANFRVQLHLGTDVPLHATTADENPRLAPAPDFPSL